MQKKSLFFAFIGTIVAVSLGGCGTTTPQQDATSLPLHDTITVSGGTLSCMDTYVGTIEPSVQAPVAFTVGGRIISLPVAQGTSLKKGQTLAIVDGEELRIGIQSITFTITALEALKQSTASMFDAQIMAIEQKVQQAKVGMSLASLDTTGAAQLQQQTAELAYQTAQTELDTTNTVLAQQETNLYNGAVQTLAQTKVFLESVGNFIDELVGISDMKEQGNDRYEMYLSVRNSSFKNEIDTQWRQLRGRYETLLPVLETFTTTYTASFTQADKDAIYETLGVTEKFLTDCKSLLKNTYQAVDASISSSAFSQTAISELKQIIVSYQNNLESMLLSTQGSFVVGIKGIKDNINTLMTQATMQRELLEKKVTIARTQMSLAGTQLDAQAQISQQQYNEALAGLEAIKKQKDAQVYQIDAQIAQARGSLVQTERQLHNTTLTAPFAGVVIRKLADVGQVISPGMPILFMGDPREGKITINIPTTKIDTVSSKTLVHIFLSSESNEFTGTVQTIAPMANIASKRVPVDIVFPMKQTALLGAQAEVRIDCGTQTGILVPENYISYDMGQAYIYILGSGSIPQKSATVVQGCTDGICAIQHTGTSILTLVTP